MSAAVEPPARRGPDLPAAQCPRCGVYPERLRDVPPAVALASFRLHHPADPAGRRRHAARGAQTEATRIPYRPAVEVILRELTPDNRQAVLALRTTPAQERFVSTVADSLREAERHPDEHPWLRAVCAGGQPVGFVMVAWDFVPEPPHADGPYFLWKLLIDREHQGKGYGTQAVEQVVDLVRADGGTELLTSYVPGEGNPFPFYAKLGFVPRGDLDPEGEIMLRRAL